ncbi:hypothetical protein D3C87_1095740 [compost metagenome]
MQRVVCNEPGTLGQIGDAVLHLAQRVNAPAAFFPQREVQALELDQIVQHHLHGAEHLRHTGGCAARRRQLRREHAHLLLSLQQIGLFLVEPRRYRHFRHVRRCRRQVRDALRQRERLRHRRQDALVEALDRGLGVEQRHHRHGGQHQRGDGQYGERGEPSPAQAARALAPARRRVRVRGGAGALHGAGGCGRCCLSSAPRSLQSGSPRRVPCR